MEGELAIGMLTNANIELGADCVTAIGRPGINIAALFFAAEDGLIYANMHTLANPAGEARGQLLTGPPGASNGKFTVRPLGVIHATLKQ